MPRVQSLKRRMGEQWLAWFDAEPMEKDSSN
jgi:hypothetical protein